MILPLFFLSREAVPYEIPKVQLVYVWSTGLIILMTLMVMISGKIKKVGKAQMLAIALLLVAILTSYFGVNFEKSWIGNYYRWDGLVTIFVLIAIFIVFSLSETDWLDSAIMGMTLGNILSSIWAGMQMILNKGIGSTGFGAGFGQPVFLAGYLIVTAPFVWLTCKQIKHKSSRVVAYILFVEILFWGLLATHALISVIGLVMIITGILLIEKKIHWKISLVLVIFVLSGVMGHFSGDIKRDKVLGGIAYESRERIFFKAYFAFLKKPFFGWGVANFDRAFDSVDWPMKIFDDVYVDKPHSNLVEVVVSQGVVGLSVYLLFIGYLFYRLFRKRDILGKTLFLVLCLYLFQSQTNVTSISEELVFWIVAAGVVLR